MAAAAKSGGLAKTLFGDVSMKPEEVPVVDEESESEEYESEPEEDGDDDETSAEAQVVDC